MNNLNKEKVNKKIQNFDKKEEFKQFPRHKNVSQYEPHSPMTPQLPLNQNLQQVPKAHSLTSRNEVEEKKTLQFSTKGH